MKKSIFLTAMMALTVLSAVFGQATHGSDAPTISCTNDALHPIAGKTYTYTATVSPDGGTAKWWTTKDTNFISNGIDNSDTDAFTTPSITVVSNYNIEETGVSSSTEMSLIWSTDLLAGTTSGTASATFVVVKYDAPSGSCADNLKVYQIDPVNAFTIDVYNISPEDGTTLTGAGSTVSTCVSEVKSASYDVASKKMVYNYGTTTLYYEVVAANFTGSYTPSFQLVGLASGQTASITWGYSTSNYDTNPLSSGISGGSTFSATSTTDVTTNVTDTSEGVSIYVKVTIDNGTYETLSTQSISLAVTGKNTADQSDILETNCDTDATFADNTATQDIKARPEVTDSTNGGIFIQP